MGFSEACPYSVVVPPLKAPPPGTGVVPRVSHPYPPPFRPGLGTGIGAYLASILIKEVQGKVMERILNEYDLERQYLRGIRVPLPNLPPVDPEESEGTRRGSSSLQPGWYYGVGRRCQKEG